MNNRWYETGESAGYNRYAANINAIRDAVTRGELTADEGKAKIKLVADETFTPSQDLSQFDTLLGKLEGAKMRQAEQANRARRGDIYSQGIAQMMSNF